MSLRIKAVIDKFFQELKEALDAEIQDRIMKEREMESYIEEREREVAEREAAWKAELSRRESEIDEYEREKDLLVGGTACNLGDAGAFEDLCAEPKEYKDTLARMRATMAHHFLVLLNTATEDNLFKIKGVAADRVQLILTLRQVSPIETLDDVARICPATLFSERQVQRLLRDLFIALYCVETEELEDFQVQMRADMDDEFLDFLNKAPWVLDIKWPTRFLNTVHLTLFMILVWENQRSRASWWAWLGFSYTRRFILAGHAPEDDSVDKTTIV